MKKWLKRRKKHILSIMTVAMVLAGGWAGFLWLVVKRPIGETAALVMVWVSVALLLVTLFPELLKHIKSVKLKDFEMELGEELRRATQTPPISLPPEPGAFFSEKAGPRELATILDQAASDRERAVLLDVDVGNGERISIVALHLYISLLSLIPNPFAVVFRSGQAQGVATRFHLSGVIDGRELGNIIRREYPEAWHSFFIFRNPEQLRLLISGGDRFEAEVYVRSLWNDLRGSIADHRLTLERFRNDILPELTDKWVTLKGDDLPSDQVRTVLENEKADWILVLEGEGALAGVLEVCRVAKRFTVEALREE